MTSYTLGIPLELSYTIQAQKDLAKEYDGIDNIVKIYDSVDENELLGEICRITAILNHAAVNRARVQNKLYGTDSEPTAITYEELIGLVSTADIPSLSMDCIHAMMEAEKPTVALRVEEASKSKKKAPK